MSSANMSTSPTGALKSPRSASCTLVEQQPAASLAALDRAHPDACRVDGLQPIQVMQRPLLRQTFTIVAHRSDGYLAGEGEPFRVSFRGPAASHPSLSDNRDGTYTCEWTAPVSGDYLVNVTLRSVPICGSPFSVRVVENGASPTSSRLVTPGCMTLVAGELGCFGVELCDGAGRVATLEPLELRTALRHTSAHASKNGEGMRVPLELTPSEEGGMATFCLTRAGSYTMHVNLRRKALPGSPFQVEVIPDLACAAASCIEGVLEVGSRRLVVGEQSSFVLQTLDRHGNACVAGGARVVASCAAAVSRASSTATPAPARCSVVDRRDGSYLVRVTCFQSGAHVLELRLDGEHVRGSPLPLTASAAPLCPEMTTLPASLPVAVAGRAAVLQLRCHDAHSNAAQPCAARFRVSLSPYTPEPPASPRSHRGQAEAVSVGGSLGGRPGGRAAGRAEGAPRRSDPAAALGGAWRGGGVYEVRYACAVAGRYLLRVVCELPDGRRVPVEAHRQLLVTPDAPDAAGSRLSVRASAAACVAADGSVGSGHGVVDLSGQSLVAGREFDLRVLLRDRCGNACAAEAAHGATEGGATEGGLELLLRGPAGEVKLAAAPPAWAVGGSATPAAFQGLLCARHMPTQRGEYSLSCTLRGEPCLGSPLRFRVIAAAADGANTSIEPPPTAHLCHVPATYVLRAHDEYGNPLEPSSPHGAVLARVCGPSRPAVVATGAPDGAVLLQVTAGLSGEYRLHATVAGVPIAEHLPFRVHANAAGSPRGGARRGGANPGGASPGGANPGGAQCGSAWRGAHAHSAAAFFRTHPSAQLSPPGSPRSARSPPRSSPRSPPRSSSSPALPPRSASSHLGWPQPAATPPSLEASVGPTLKPWVPPGSAGWEQPQHWEPPTHHPERPPPSRPSSRELAQRARAELARRDGAASAHGRARAAPLHTSSSSPRMPSSPHTVLARSPGGSFLTSGPASGSGARSRAAPRPWVPEKEWSNDW